MSAGFVEAKGTSLATTLDIRAQRVMDRKAPSSPREEARILVRATREARDINKEANESILLMMGTQVVSCNRDMA